MKKLTFYPAGKNLLKVSKILLGQKLFTFNPNAIFMTVSVGF